VTQAAVLDCSVVTDLLVGNETRTLAASLPTGDWHAPSHLDIEVASALRGLVLGRHLGRPRATDALTDFSALEIKRWHPDGAFLVRVLQLGNTMTAYDAGYVVCAEGLSVPLVTRDRRLARAAARYVDVHTV
jgi:predicted nucleic acid-binding protein